MRVPLYSGRRRDGVAGLGGQGLTPLGSDARDVAELQTAPAHHLVHDVRQRARAPLRRQPSIPATKTTTKQDFSQRIRLKYTLPFEK